MFIYNNTIKVNNEIENDWLNWQKEINIPEIMSTKLFYDHKIFKLLGQGETDGETYIIQFYSENKSSCEKFAVLHSENFSKIMLDKWNDKFIVFQSLLESVQ